VTTRIIGFTGTKLGMASAQEETLKSLLFQKMHEGPIEAHHGDCVGADAGFHDIICELRSINLETNIVIHPPIRFQTRAFRGTGQSWVTILPQKDYVDRDYDIVDASDEMFATPRGAEQVRSGTWTTVRYARRRGRRITIIWPNGSVTVENERVDPQGVLL